MNRFEHFFVRDVGDITLVSLADPRCFEVSQYSQLRDELQTFVQTEQPAKLVVDFSSVEYCSTAIISSLIKVKESLAAEGRELKFCGMSDSVRDAFRMLNLDGNIFDIHRSQESAIAAF